jgi:hypothetical protein
MSYSFISGVAVRIGTDVLETMDDGTVIVNGDSLREYNEPSTFAGFRVNKSVKGKMKNIFVYDLDLRDSKTIQIRANTKTGMIFVDVRGAFLDSIGLLGASAVDDERSLACDGETVLTGEWNTLGGGVAGERT